MCILSKLPKGFLSNPVHFAAFGFGSGCSPFAPGTFGTLVGVLLYLAMQSLSLWSYLVLVLVAFILGTWFCAKASRALGVHDHGGIVWDEFVGYWITMFAAPQGWEWIVGGFLLFRLFDIWKPQPIKFVDQRVHGGFGIMLDDVLAGVYAWLVLQLIAYAINVTVPLLDAA
jgi:phosphatidylglycerophosphatase A